MGIYDDRYYIMAIDSLTDTESIVTGYSKDPDNIQFTDKIDTELGMFGDFEEALDELNYMGNSRFNFYIGNKESLKILEIAGRLHAPKPVEIVYAEKMVHLRTQIKEKEAMVAKAVEYSAQDRMYHQVGLDKLKEKQNELLWEIKDKGMTDAVFYEMTEKLAWDSVKRDPEKRQAFENKLREEYGIPEKNEISIEKINEIPPVTLRESIIEDKNKLFESLQKMMDVKFSELADIVITEIKNFDEILQVLDEDPQKVKNLLAINYKLEVEKNQILTDMFGKLTSKEENILSNDEER